jgi:formyltetrahydrofolate-dependent phosphoribosylglycinamide formyltransferase
VRENPIRLGVLISGGGTTLTNFLEKIDAGELSADVSIVIASRECAGIAKAKGAGLRCELLSRRTFETTAQFSEAVFSLLRGAEVDLATFAGFLSRVDIPADFEHRVMNIHPALLPSFGGKGMHGTHVHEAVLARGCKVSGCTIHFADNEYDHGPIILQRCVPVLEGDSPRTLAARVFEAECVAYPEAIQMYGEGRLRVEGSLARISE